MMLLLTHVARTDDELTLYGDGDDGAKPIEAQLRWSMVKYVLPLRSARRGDDE